MPKAVWNGWVLAEAERGQVQKVEENIYFPRSTIKPDFFKESPTETVCKWKGTAKYYTLDIGDQQMVDGAWYYPNPKPMAANIKDFIAFGKDVEVTY